MNNLGLVCNSYDVVDESRERSRRPDMPDLAAAKSIQLRVEQLCDEIVLFTSMEEIDRYEQGRSVGQEIPGKVAEPAMALQEQMNAFVGQLKLVRPGLLTPHSRSPTAGSDSLAVDRPARLSIPRDVSDSGRRNRR